MPTTESLDPAAVGRQFDRRGRDLARADFLYREIERQMLERLDVVRLAPERVLDLGCGLGKGLLALAQRYENARLVGLDRSGPVLAAARPAVRPSAGGWLGRLLASRSSTANRIQLLQADAAAVPMPAGSVDLVWSNLCLHWLSDPSAVLAEAYRVLRAQGLFMFSQFGVDTLKELRGPDDRLPHFADMHDIGDALTRIGFADPVMDVHWVTLTFDSPGQLLADLHSLGGNPVRGRRPGLTSRERHRRWLDTLAARRERDGRLELTVEVVFGHAWCPEVKRRADGLTPITIQRPGATG